MNIKQIEKMLIKAGIEQNEAKIESKMFIQHFLGLTSVDLALSEELNSSDDQLKNLLQAVNARIQTRRPIQHILGKAYFMGEYFIVNDSVLIPRDETEILVRKAVEIIKKNNFRQILDIGTGSGCIACMIAKLTNTQVLGVDISANALQIALDNTSRMGLFNKAIFRKSDIFSKIRENEKFDVIISNPPYIPIDEKNNLQIEVKYEPESALFAKDVEGIDFYKEITKKAPKYLNKGGYLMFELGINQSSLVKDLMEKAGFVNIEIQKDLAYIDRIIYGRYQ